MIARKRWSSNSRSRSATGASWMFLIISWSLFRFVSFWPNPFFCAVSFRLDSFRCVPFRGMPFRLVLFRFMPFQLVSFSFVSLLFVPFRFLSFHFVRFFFYSFCFGLMLYVTFSLRFVSLRCVTFFFKSEKKMRKKESSFFDFSAPKFYKLSKCFRSLYFCK